MPRLITKITKTTLFTFENRIELSLEERNILKRVDAFEHKLGGAGQFVTVNDLTKGRSVEFPAITDLLDHERQIKAVAAALRDMIESLRALGAERSVVI